MAFYGAIEQLLTGWIFGLLPQGEEHFERAKWLVRGDRLRRACEHVRPSTRRNRLARMMENDMVKRLDVVGPAGRLGALASIARPPRGRRVWSSLFGEEPPE